MRLAPGRADLHPLDPTPDGGIGAQIVVDPLAERDVGSAEIIRERHGCAAEIVAGAKPMLIEDGETGGSLLFIARENRGLDRGVGVAILRKDLPVDDAV